MTLLPVSAFLRYNVGRGFFSPYAGIGFTYMSFKEESEFVGNIKGNGSNFSLEAGFELKMNRHFFLDFGARFDQIKVKPEIRRGNRPGRPAGRHFIAGFFLKIRFFVDRKRKILQYST